MRTAMGPLRLLLREGFIDRLCAEVFGRAHDDNSIPDLLQRDNLPLPHAFLKQLCHAGFDILSDFFVPVRLPEVGVYGIEVPGKVFEGILINSKWYTAQVDLLYLIHRG